MANKQNVKLVQSVYHALQLFEVFRTSEKREEYGVTELSKTLGLHKNNVFRLLATLESRGYIEQNQFTENYRLGIGIFNLGQKFVNKLGLLKLAKPFMEKIVAETKESVYIGILREGAVIYLDIVEADQTVRIVSRVGKDAPAYCTAIGKIQLAYASEEEINKVYMGARLKRYTDNTITSLPELKKHLKTVSEKDYAFDDEEFEESVRCIAVPVKDYLGVPVAALSVTGPACRMSYERMNNEILPVVQKYAREISKRLGFHG
ncbi:IclR family transcriptional regulator [Deferribacterales bacterium Es71-Z0220]|jgi:DNA-binding IclR family transcriptional regulator|uniref:IclR family transcriptional regulator n=1 Tax=Deferrivibrio essentukiensis TaxID=2880922 RepID=UPI001F6168BC|nr:IclR family transcriptional regulator [Deferrivibrio essentukiensis]MBZ4672425.1 transcriptional regulator, IclR family [Deferribacteraceae bacterium]MCB4205146.1 IclR family transcriptional regulator [Deferrivibrio essentukiensis]